MHLQQALAGIAVVVSLAGAAEHTVEPMIESNLGTHIALPVDNHERRPDEDLISARHGVAGTSGPAGGNGGAGDGIPPMLTANTIIRFCFPPTATT